ncbi:MAG: hypothetical protein VR70_07205 [Rhodospirillaceae bacterium BRH_c57]|nr:MAG: hypothetical protein VR70_07205 [Rhodospirillaceae bacterium BRH_c57]
MRMWLLLAGINGAMAVAAGAYAAHGLTEAGPQAIHWMSLASTYQLIHATALGVVGTLTPILRAGGGGLARILNFAAGGLMTAGIVLFCGALYGLALDVAWLMPGTAPVGGFAFMAGWLSLAGAGVASKAKAVEK